jgi:hypothetical protein
MTEIIEGNLRVRFDETWTVIKYDDHPEYRNRLNSIPETMALDIVGLRKVEARRGLYFIEVKDYSQDRLQNHRELLSDVCRKFRDTVFGLLIAFRNATDKHVWQPFIDNWSDTDCRFSLIIVIELDHRALTTQKAHAGVLANALNPVLKRNGVAVHVVTTRHEHPLDGVQMDRLFEADTRVE